MPIIRSNPIRKLVNGNEYVIPEVVIVSEPSYSTTGEGTVIVRGVNFCKIKLDSKNTDTVSIKAMTNTLIIPDKGKIDEMYDEIIIDNSACVTFSHAGGNWYIISSDGLKMEGE